MGLISVSLTPETALKETKLQAFVLSCFQDERPLQGAIGELDWWLIQPFSKAIRSGVFSGANDERMYLPFRLKTRTLHFLVLGQGSKHAAGRQVKNKTRFANELLEFQKNFGFKNIALFASDGISEKNMEGSFDLWILNS